MYANIVLLILPWFWIVAAAIIAIGARRGPKAATWFAVALAAYGTSAFFISHWPDPPWWLVAWQLAAALSALAAAWRSRVRKRLA